MNQIFVNSVIPSDGKFVPPPPHQKERFTIDLSNVLIEKDRLLEKKEVFFIGLM